MSLVLLHREPNVAPVPDGAATWRTCLREVVFLDECHDTDAQPGQCLRERAAYQLLLEILCGLRSPMLGETQVLGQFKAFLAEAGKAHPSITRLGQRLLTDARDVRTQHLQGLGSRSYGSAVRRDLADCSRTVLIGTGKLADEVLPFLSDDGRTVEQWGRAQLEHPGDHFFQPREKNDPRDLCIVVAAPVGNEVIEWVASQYDGVRRVIDLRAETGDRPLAIDADIVSLQDLFARMHAASDAAAPRIEAAKTEIAWRSRQFEMRDELRPFGWDDLCA